jgi:YYY domain-containing protein
MVLAWLIVVVISLAVYLRRSDDKPMNWREWWRENRVSVITAEMLFAVLLIGWATVRAHQNEVIFTEKPMELAFISSVMRSDTYPPSDPWMAGYAISYYYFGYVMAAMLSMLSGISSATGFNMLISLIFALVGLTTFGVVYNLVRLRAFQFKVEYPAAANPSRRIAVLTGLVGAVLVAVMGNWQVLMIEMPYQTGTASADYLAIYDSNERQTPIGEGNESQSLADWSRGGWWWFRSARVLNDRQLDGNRQEVIDEFPAFSYLLADNHPHVLSLPFATLAIGLALNTLLSSRAPDRTQIVFYAVCLGGLIFLNTWDAPIYMAAVVAADGLRRLIRNGGGRLSTSDILSMAGLGMVILILSVIFYLPFLVSFRSQLGGVLPNLQFPTNFAQFFVMFAPFLLILGFFLGVEVWRAGDRVNWRMGVLVGLGLLGLLIFALLFFALIAAAIPSLQSVVTGFIESNGGLGNVLPQMLSKRIAHILTTIVLTIGLIFVVARLFPRVGTAQAEAQADDKRVIKYPPATGFALILVAIGLMLTLTPEFVYLRDNFSTRMNTVFKFYYQAWLVWSIASAYAIYTLLADAEQPRPSLLTRGAFTAIAVIAITGGMLFTIFGIYSRAHVEPGRRDGAGPELTLNGARSFVRSGLITENDFLSLTCLGELEPRDDVIVAEAVGGSYQWAFGRVATLTGLANLINWPGHQGQWRGSTFGTIAGSREGDIDRLYSDPTWSNARNTISSYGIDYIFFGSNERNEFGAAADVKFRDNLEIICEYGDTRVYRVGDQDLTGQ